MSLALPERLFGGSQASACRKMRKRRLSAPPSAAGLRTARPACLRSPQSHAERRRCPHRWSPLRTRAPPPLTCGSSNFNARVAYPRRRFHGTTEYPTCPRQCGGSSVVPGCQRNLIEPQNSPSHIHCEYPGRRGTVEPSGRAIGGPFASRSTCSERNRSGSWAILASSSSAVCGRRLSGDQPC